VRVTQQAKWHWVRADDQYTRLMQRWAYYALAPGLWDYSNKLFFRVITIIRLSISAIIAG